MKKTDQSQRATFKEAYASLNVAQKEAVDSIEGPVMVVAGPGTGKTQILTLRIANILLKTDTPPDGILALTFTDSGAKAMRERLRFYIGSEAYRVPIFTFHGFAQNLIADYPDAYYRVVGGRPASDLEKIGLIESILEATDFKLLRPLGNPSYYVNPIINVIGKLKQENITPDKFALTISEQEANLATVERYHSKGAHVGKIRGEYTRLEKSIAKNRELLMVYRQYEALLNDRLLYDFDDMILETVTALSNNEDMLRDLQEKYLYLLADEHQDVNGAQNRILELLASYHEAPNIFAVGDEKQAIYRFQGASLQNFLYFKEIFTGTKVIELTDNYRSGQVVLDTAHSLIAVESGPLVALRVPLFAKVVTNSSVERRDFSHQAVEDDWLVEAVQNRLDKGVVASDIAIIVRTNREVEKLAQHLRKAKIPVTASAEGDILQHPITVAVRQLVEAVLNEKNESSLFAVLHGAYWGIKPDDLLRLLSARSYDQSLVRLIGDESALNTLKITDPMAISRVNTVLNFARDRMVDESPQRVLEYLIKESGLLAHVLKNDSIESGRVIRRLYDEFEELAVRNNCVSLKEVSEALKQRSNYGLPLSTPYIATDLEAVQIMTAHRSKGLEFSVVFLPHVTDNVWGGTVHRKLFSIPLQKEISLTDDDHIEDERRLFYVVITRAKHELLVSCAKTNSDGKELTPSRFLYELSDHTVTTVSTTEVEQRFSPTTIIERSCSPAFSLDLARLVIQERGFSATAINNYLKSPWEFFFRNVLRIPEVQPLPMLYGTAVHSVLEFATRQYTSCGELPNPNTIKQQIERVLSRLPLSTAEFSKMHEQSLTELIPYLSHLAKTLPKRTKEEFNIRVMMPTGLAGLPEVPLTGKLDRLDFDEYGQVVRVFDYKTGKPKTRNDIEGKTKDSNGDYKRQLVFYSLLLSLYDDERYRCFDGVLSFVRPDQQGNIREERFITTEDEIDELRREIIEATRNIITGEFVKQPCDLSLNNFCHLVPLWISDEQ